MQVLLALKFIRPLTFSTSQKPMTAHIRALEQKAQESKMSNQIQGPNGFSESIGKIDPTNRA